MAKDGKINAKVAMVYDLLSQEGKLHKSQIETLQNLLNEMALPVGEADSIMGKNTARGILNFLQKPEHRIFSAQISQTMEQSLRRYGQGDAIDRLNIQSDLGEEAHKSTAGLIQATLQEDGLSKNSVVALQGNLEVLGYELGNIDGDFGKKTSAALVNYLQENPEDLLTIDPSILHIMMQKGQASNLIELAAGVPAFQERIQEQLTALGVTDDPTVLSSSLDHNAIIDLQILLSIAGKNPGGIDGIVGNKTLAGTERFLAQQSPSQLGVTTPIISTQTTTPPHPEPSPIHSGKIATDGYTQTYEGDNGYGVSNLAIERAWARITHEDADLRNYDGQPSGGDNNPRPLIVIDLGHGSDINANDSIDTGAASPHNEGLSEVSVVDPVSAEMARQLHELGYDVALTRNPGEQLRVEGTHGQTLRVRPEFAHQLADELQSDGVMFLSIHLNSFAKEHANGSRLYVDVDGARITNESSSKLADSISETFAVSAKKTSVKHIGDLSVIDNFEDGLTTPDDVSAGILVELGFLSNKKDAAALEQMRDKPTKAAAQIVEGINDYVISKRPELAPPQTIELAQKSDFTFSP
jgi:N-acetylmuramoyl-L-alanine amidase